MFRKIVIASDSFKGSVSSSQVADAAEAAIRSVIPSCEVIKVSIADGGEGTMESLCQALDARVMTVQACDPLGRRIESSYAISGNTAIIEMSKASGLPLLEENLRNPMLTSTFGTGELILDALDHGCTDLLVGIGGSATNDGGTGMMAALGARFLDSRGNELEGIGGNLNDITSIDLSGLDSRLRKTTITVACDVDTPFHGPDGAAYVFAPQKGADKIQTEILDRGLENLSRVILATTGNDIGRLPGSGAAGGLGGAFKGLLGATLKQGIDMVLDSVRFDSTIEDADLVITGEGKMDFQTPKGKTAAGVLARAQRQGIPVVALAGKVEMCPELSGMGFERIIEVSAGLPLHLAMNPQIAMGRIEESMASYLKSLDQTL